jgi:hypothetical protein
MQINNSIKFGKISHIGTINKIEEGYTVVRLISYGLLENGTLIYSDGSCTVFGDDGKRLNISINKPYKKTVSTELAEALIQA